MIHFSPPFVLVRDCPTWRAPQFRNHCYTYRIYLPEPRSVYLLQWIQPLNSGRYIFALPCMKSNRKKIVGAPLTFLFPNPHLICYIPSLNFLRQDENNSSIVKPVQFYFLLVFFFCFFALTGSSRIHQFYLYHTNSRSCNFETYNPIVFFTFELTSRVIFFPLFVAALVALFGSPVTSRFSN